MGGRKSPFLITLASGLYNSLYYRTSTSRDQLRQSHLNNTNRNIISILIVIGTCTRSCARVRVSRQSRARRSRVSACRGEAALRRVAAKPRTAKPRVRVSCDPPCGRAQLVHIKPTEEQLCLLNSITCICHPFEYCHLSVKQAYMPQTSYTLVTHSVQLISGMDNYLDI